MRRQPAHGLNSSSNIEIMEKEMTADIGRQRFIFASVVLVFLLADWLSKRLFQGWLDLHTCPPRELHFQLFLFQ